MTNVESEETLTLLKGLGDILILTILSMSLIRLGHVDGYFHTSTNLDWSKVSAYDLLLLSATSSQNLKSRSQLPALNCELYDLI